MFLYLTSVSVVSHMYHFSGATSEGTAAAKVEGAGIASVPVPEALALVLSSKLKLLFH